MAAVGLNNGRIPTYWMPPAAAIHVSRWMTGLGLTPEQILEVARTTRRQHPEPPNGPKALDGAMQRCADVQRAPPLAPSPHAAGTPRYSDPPPKVDVKAIMAEISRKREEQERARET